MSSSTRFHNLITEVVSYNCVPDYMEDKLNKLGKTDVIMNFFFLFIKQCLLPHQFGSTCCHRSKSKNMAASEKQVAAVF